MIWIQWGLRELKTTANYLYKLGMAAAVAGAIFMMSWVRNRVASKLWWASRQVVSIEDDCLRPRQKESELDT
jgi:hypothetical protein